MPSLNEAKASALSQRLGRLLAMADSCKEGDNSRQSLDQRIRALQAVLQKRQRKLAPNSRRQCLIETLGTQKAGQIISLIREVRVLRLRRRDLLAPAALESHQPFVCTREGGCSKNLYSLKTSQNGKLCKEVKDIFFNTPLVEALEKSPVANFRQLPWDDMYAQAAKNVQAYRTFLNNEKALQEDLATNISSR